jgi:hypothetical protein
MHTDIRTHTHHTHTPHMHTHTHTHTHTAHARAHTYAGTTAPRGSWPARSVRRVLAATAATSRSTRPGRVRAALRFSIRCPVCASSSFLPSFLACGLLSRSFACPASLGVASATAAAGVSSRAGGGTPACSASGALLSALAAIAPGGACAARRQQALLYVVCPR